MQEAAACEKKLCLALNHDVNDARDVIVELRSEAETDEATAFTDLLLQMLTRASERHGWKWTILEERRAANYGLQSVVAKVAGHNVYRYLKYEAGIHCAIGVPTLHSSRKYLSVTASIVVMPLVMADEAPLREEDIHAEVYFTMSGTVSHLRPRYPNTIRLRHQPSNIIVVCEATDNKYTLAQLRATAELLLRTRLNYSRLNYAAPQVDTCLIRTYDWPNEKVKDRRIHIAATLADVWNGSLQPLWDALIVADEAMALRFSTES